MVENKIGIYATEDELKFIIDLIGKHGEDDFAKNLSSELRNILMTHKAKVKAEQSLPPDELREQINPYLNVEKTPVTNEMEKQYPRTMEAFNEIIGHQYNVFSKKQADYGPGNISMNNNKNLSILGLGVRMNDKTQRVLNIAYKKSQPENESLKDSFMDLSIYGIIAQIVLRNDWGH